MPLGLRSCAASNGNRCAEEVAEDGDARVGALGNGPDQLRGPQSPVKFIPNLRAACRILCTTLGPRRIRKSKVWMRPSRTAHA